MMSTATPGLTQNPEIMVTSAQSAVASNLSLAFNRVVPGVHNISGVPLDQTDNAAVSIRNSIEILQTTRGVFD